MRIGIIGAGKLGTALGTRLAALGHDIMLSFSRDPDSLNDAAARCGAAAGTPQSAVSFSDVLILATNWGSVDTALAATGRLHGTVVWDCTNALKDDLSGLDVGTSTSGGEIVQRLAPGARVVKAIPPFAGLIGAADALLGGMPSGCFMCGNDDGAKAIVRPLLEALPTAVTDAGPLEAARWVEPASFLLVHLAYRLGMGSRLGLALLSDDPATLRGTAA